MPNDEPKNDEIKHDLSPEEIQDLERLNVTIGRKEDRGDRAWFIENTAPEFAFMRGDRKTFDDRTTFLLKVAPKKKRDRARKTTEIKVIPTPNNKNRAIVSCLVTIGEKKFYNLRVFVKTKMDENWKLLAWANEPLIDKPLTDKPSENEPLKQ